MHNDSCRAQASTTPYCSWKVYQLKVCSYSNLFSFDSQDNSDDGIQEFLVGAQTEGQKKILENYNSNKPLYVEGPSFIWVRRLQRHFFTLRTDAELDEENGEGMVTIIRPVHTGAFCCGNSMQCLSHLSCIKFQTC